MPGFIRLTRDLTLPIAAPVWPAGVTPAPFSASVAPKVHALMRLAYTEGGGTVAAEFDAWWTATRHDPEFDAGLCFLAAADGEPVGFVLCWTSGFAKDAVVHPGWRRRGIATALLNTAFLALARRGHTEAALKVHAGNEKAQRL